MKKILYLFHHDIFHVAIAMLCVLLIGVSAGPYQAFAATPPQPFVAIHVSELTQALETIPATPPTPTGTDTSGYQWWYTSWHYFVAYESLKEALRSDGTPFVEVSDSDIAAGKLRSADGSPRYPILISLDSEAIDDNEIAPLRDYVNAGGFLFIGSSAFTRYPGGSNRGNFALAAEMGLRMANSSLTESNNWNWSANKHFTKSATHRLTSHIPNGTLAWNGPSYSEEIPWGVSPTYELHGTHWVWTVVANGATVIANGDAGPLLAAKNYGKGQFIYHGAMQPILGHGVIDPSMYSYLIYRKSIEWAFESFSLPIVKLSPWRYPFDAALLVRHDFEGNIGLIKTIKSSAQYEDALGIAGDYYFCTGALRTYSGTDRATIISNMRDAVSVYGATIGSHNGGLKNPDASLPTTDEQYWHWGPDQALDKNFTGYANGKAYASDSILRSFQDIEGWLVGLDNGRTGCGATKTCPRNWASPLFNSTREDSYDVLAQLGSITMGEQKIGPYPHWTLSYETPGKYYSHLSLPTSDWFVGTEIPQALDMGHTFSSIREAVDFYHGLGAMLLNFYGHQSSDLSGLEQDYVTYSMAKPNVWSTNAVGIYDWWLLRSKISITPDYTMSGNTSVVTTSVSGNTGTDTALEVVLPQIPGQTIGAMTVFLNGTQAGTADYRTTNYGLKVRVGSSVSSVKVQYAVLGANTAPVAVNDSYSTNRNTVLTTAAPGVLANDTDPEGTTLTAQLVTGPSHGTLTLNSTGSFTYTPTTDYVGSDSFTYLANDGTTSSTTATVTVTITPTGNVLFADDFTRSVNPPLLSPWTSILGTWAVTSGVLNGSGTAMAYSHIYYAPTPLWVNYAVEGRFQFVSSAFGGGLGCRVNPATGAQYSAWIFPDNSIVGPNVLQLVKQWDWTTYSGTEMAQASLPSVGTGWHTLKLVCNGNRIQVFYDGTSKIDVTDNNYDSRAPYLSGGIDAGMGTFDSVYTMSVDNVVVSTLVPVAVNDTYSTNQNIALTTAAPGVLVNDTGGSSTLTAQLVSGPSHGTLVLNSNGSFSYTPTTGYTGSDSFTYQANDGTNSSNVATATISVSSALVLSSLSLTPSTVKGGTSSQGTVKLSGPAPSGGAVISLSDNSSAVGVPATVTVPSGSSTATFNVTTRRVYSAITVTITAAYKTVTKSATLRVTR
jgi:VCBS repeat-containing protein